MEGCDVRWLGLRAMHVEMYKCSDERGDSLTRRDESILRGLESRMNSVGQNSSYLHEINEMRRLGKYELQWLYGRGDGHRFFSQTFLVEGILKQQYI